MTSIDQDLPPAYRATEHERAIYARWEAAGCFAAGCGARREESFCIMIPPPNVTGVLHMGHALNNTLQDALIRWKRMQGFDTLWQPGTDHAGIATQAVVAKRLAEQGLCKEDMDREEFLRHVWTYKEQFGGVIVRQLRELGCSCDWSRERFTMDEGLSRAVRENFVRLYHAGLIYQGTRMVNWDPVLRTALSDDEVEMREGEAKMWKLRYPLSDGSGHIEVETTRPETFFGDTAVAVHPEDPRYRDLIGSTLRLPVVGREIPIIADQHADPSKGSGAVKITPCHDPNDYQVGLRHDLPLVQCIGFDGVMTAEAGPYAGQDRQVCRQLLLADLAVSGVLTGERTIQNAVGHGDRSGVPIEPMVTTQWFVRMQPLAERALTETSSGRVTFHPDRWTKVYASWLENVQDWCISRQIWWGHRIPAWHDLDSGEVIVSATDPTTDPANVGRRLEQDPDVLDTWFSSALWPFSTLGWPEADPALARYYPTSTLVTDRGIIYFWVARMVMMGLFNLDQRPFDDVYIHGTVLDRNGAKMSKSKGNGIDPLVMISGGQQDYLGERYDSPGYGADAVRYTLLDMTTEGQDLKLEPARFEAGRNFANKVWNAGRFLLLNLGERPLASLPSAADLATRQLDFPARWLLDRLQQAVEDCTTALERFRFSEYVGHAYRFFRDDLCDWYLEWAKRCLRSGGPAADDATAVLAHSLEAALRLLHPGMPFVTELLWQHLRGVTGAAAWAGEEYLMLAAWPEPAPHLRLPEAAEHMAQLQALVVAVRQARNELGLPERSSLTVCLDCPSPARAAVLSRDLAFLDDRAAAQWRLAPLAEAGPGLSTAVGDLRLRLELGADQREALSGYRARLEKQLAGKRRSAAGKRTRLDNPGYTNKAPPEQVAQTRALLAVEETEIGGLEQALAALDQDGQRPGRCPA